MSEVWKPIPGHPNYEASTLGRVRSLSRIISRPNRYGQITQYSWAGRVLKPIPHRGYLVVKLGDPNLAFGIHQIVALTFHGPCPDGFVPDHVDTDKTNSTPGNLEYVTNPENVKRAYATGCLNNTGASNGNAKLSDEQTEAIRSRYGRIRSKQLAEEFGVSRQQIFRIAKGKQRALAT